ncbi:MAG: hypothetical protein IJI36_10835 [Kiritimatiellae bacterium]|nr:hypothetical protein [Kiritimatiellia bacterium]
MRSLFFAVATACLAASAETISVPAGKTERVEPGRRFEGNVLVKEGEGTLDLTGAVLANAGLDVREGAVRFAAGASAIVTARYLRFDVRETRPGKKGPPEYGGSGSQFSEFRLYRGGKALPMPKDVKAMNGNPSMREGPQKALDGDLKTKCYFNPLIVDLGEDVTFDGYSFVTANDAIGRDPRCWTLAAGTETGGDIAWSTVGSVNGFEAPKERFTEAGKIFPVALKDVVPANYPVTVGGKGRLVLSGASETLERCAGEGLIVLENATVDFAPQATFNGSVSGGGTVSWRK